MKVLVDASCNILYSSYYLYGLYQLYGNKVSFSASAFKDLNYSLGNFAFILKTKHKTQRVVIDFKNGSAIDTAALAWCDVYGKVNLEEKDQDIEKVVPIGPLMAIKVFNRHQTIWYAFTNLLKSYKKIKDVKRFLSDYKAQYSRKFFDTYPSANSQDNYVFFAASLWKKEHTANERRANFIQACQTNNNIDFEGGFAPRNNKDINGYEQFTMKERIDLSEFSKKTAASAFVFNIPTVNDCNGWRLAEYFYMGKAIITTPLKRLLPQTLINKQHVLYVSGTVDSIEEAIEQLQANPALKAKLEQNSKAYFDQYLRPERVIQSLINHLKSYEQEW